MAGEDRGRAIAAEWTASVRAFFGRRCARTEDAEDLAQDALCAIIEGAARFRGGSSEATWVYAICRNVFSSWLRARERDARLAEAASREALAAGGDAGGGTGIPRGGGDEAGERRDLGLALESLLASLRPSERGLYRLYYVEGRQVREIAEIIGRPEGTVKYLLSCLRARLGELLGAAGP